jgi:polyferredoxin
VVGLSFLVVTVPIIIYTTFGTAWCGWACPQNLLTEWANNLTHKLLGKRASVDVNGEGLKVAAAKNKLINWFILAAAFLAASMLLALIPFYFFFSPSEVWSFFTLSASATLSKFMQRLYAFTVLLIFIDIAVVRYFLCDYACMYRIGQKIFKTPDALHVAYDETRSADCTKCNYCAATCITSIQPTQISMYDSCIDCGECVDACNRLHAKSGTTGLLKFEFGSKGNNSTLRDKLAIAFSRSNLAMGAIALLGIGLMAWGAYTQQALPPKVPFAVQQKAMELARVCNNQCAKQQAACTANNVEGCYRAAACKCECSLQQDPSNAAAPQWQQCVQRNNANAQALSLRSSGLKPRDSRMQKVELMGAH